MAGGANNRANLWFQHDFVYKNNFHFQEICAIIFEIEYQCCMKVIIKII